jgi:predicted DNA-binding protein
MYPLDNPDREKEKLENNWLPEGYDFVRFKIRDRDSMFLRSVAFSTISDYRSGEDENYILTRLKKEMIDFLKDDSPYTQKGISKKIKEELEKDLKNLPDLGLSDEEKEELKKLKEEDVEIHIPESGNILGSYFSLGTSKGYPFFKEEEIRDYPPNSNLFALNNFKYITNYMIRRIRYREIKNELQELAILLEEDKLKCEYALGKGEDFKIARKNLEEHRVLEIIDLIKNQKNEKLTQNEGLSFSSILRMNICLLRAWKENVSLEEYFYFDESFPTLLVFYTKEGYVGPEGTYTDVKYFPGAITYRGRIKYFLDPKQDELLIYQLLKYDLTDNARILESNYQHFLEKGDQEISELEEIEVPEYGKLREILKDDGDIDEIGKIISSMNLV